MATQMHIIDNKKVALTQNEWDMYQSICKSYDRQNFKGEDLFKDLFETDDNGIIIFLKPPSIALMTQNLIVLLVKFEVICQ